MGLCVDGLKYSGGRIIHLISKEVKSIDKGELVTE
jgi:hypothetical protein